MTAAASPRRHHVLVVEDIPTFRRAYSHALLGGGYDVTSTSQGLEALQLLDAARPDVIVTEVSMPVMDGITFVTELRTRGCATPVLVLADDEFLRCLAMRVGGDGFLVQPFGPQALLERVADLLRHDREQPARRHGAA